MSMTTYKLSGGSLGNDLVYIRCDLSDASNPVQVDYDEGNGWDSTQYQFADCRHGDAGLIRIGKELAAQAIGHDEDYFECESESIKNFGFEIGDANAAKIADSFDEAVEIIAEWYEDADGWAGGIGDDDTHTAIRKAIESIDQPEDGGVSDLQSYADEICQAVAVAMGGSDFSGHGNYSVSAADSAGIRLMVSEITDPR